MVSLTAPDVLVCPLPLQEKLVTPVGSGSLTVTFVAAPVPELETTIVYVVVVPGTAEFTPSVFETCTSLVTTVPWTVMLGLNSEVLFGTLGSARPWTPIEAGPTAN